MKSSLASFSAGFYADPESKFAVDVSRMGISADYLDSLRDRIQLALHEMSELEKGAISNKDESRMVGHYWLRAPHLAPDATLRASIEGTLGSVKEFASAVRSGRVRAPSGERFSRVHVIGIGGSALGPQFVADSLVSPTDPVRISFFDNTDPDGMERVLLSPEFRLAETLVVVVSKSGGTKETRNGEVVMKRAFEASSISWPPHFVAVTGEGSELDNRAISEGWLARFPMWDWVGGRTSELSAVGLLPAALQGIDVDEMLRGAAHLDSLTRSPSFENNPALMLAVSWLWVGNERGARDMVILPYKDRLQLLSRYLQQLVMESLGKELDRSGQAVHQGIAVYGNKGSTDQHAYVQQLRDGLDNFFVTFIEVLEDGIARYPSESNIPSIKDIQVEPGASSGDYLFGFLYGTREALTQRGRPSLVISIPQVSPFAIGALIALFERAVGFYASLINVNAYHQPGVEAGKQAAERILQLQRRVEAILLASSNSEALSIQEVCRRADLVGEEEMIFQMLRRWSANGKGVLTNSHSPVQASFIYQPKGT
jgi:glucose-6-phosphate isomerase